MYEARYAEALVAMRRQSGDESGAQEVIDACWSLGDDNPVLSIHDVGAGGLSNAVPELVNDSGRGGSFELRAVPNDDPGMSPMQVWCNESQERYVLAIDSARLADFQALCAHQADAVGGVQPHGLADDPVDPRAAGVDQCPCA